MGIVSSYKKQIVENKNLVFISIFLICFIRLCLLYTSEPPAQFASNGYLFIEHQFSLLSKSYISVSFALLFTFAIVFYLTILNTRHKLIRNRTYLIFLLPSLLFSCHPDFVYMNPQYISLLLVILAIDILFSMYLKGNASGGAYGVGFFLALASLFSLSTLIYLPVFWIGFKYMRCLKFKSVAASIIGVFSVYWILLFFFLWLKDFDAFLQPFREWYPIVGDLYKNLSLDNVLIPCFLAVILVVAMIDYTATSYYDKIQARANLSFIYILTVFSILAYFFIIYNPLLNIFVFILGCSLTLSHFFSLTEQKWKISLFYIFISLYFIVFMYLLLNKVITAILAS